MRYRLTTPVLPAFFIAFSALLAGCSSTPHANGEDAQNAATAAEKDSSSTEADSDKPAFDLTVKAPDDVRKYLEQYIDLKRYRSFPGLQLTELTRLLGSADENVRELLGTLGYFSPEIQIDVFDTGAAPVGDGISAADSEARPQIVISVTPGVQTKVADVALDYSGAVTEEKNFASRRERLQRNWDLQPGAGFTQKGWDGAKSEGLRALQRRRYPTAKIESSKADIDGDTNQARLSVHYDSGPLYKFGPLLIQGAERYDPVGTARIARLPTGRDYSETAMLDAQTRLAASGYYDSVFLTLDTDTQTPEAAPVIAQVREAKLQKVVFGIGMSTDTGPRLSLDHTHNKMPLLGWRAVSKLSFERDKKLISTEWTDLPGEDGWADFAGGEIKREINGDFTINSTQIRGGHKKSTDHIDRSAFLQYDFSSSVQGLEKIPSSSAISANYGWTGRYFNNNTNPTRGYGIAAELGAGFTLTPQRDPFIRTLLRWQGFVPAGTVTAPNGSSRGARLALRAEGGAILAKDSAVIPATQLFITGGDTTVRGYGYKQIGASVAGNKVYGGRYMYVGSVEYQRPLVRNGEVSDWESAVFADVGSVADKVGDMTPYWGIGTGLRWRSPVGALQADVAYGLKDQRFRLHLRLGYSF
ncbi:translocation and assembly module TamA [Comamonas odontotermitis]|uniref:Translocation and assembly module TamA n=1 Tax=Comamonas odontotermitis TaxID=379895 RepID=A0ABR6RE14_9BURK|nr:BamA/TamA family outer membrane protein [Comamonas odontotermitis]MBB6577405.1 translocation and assembly module TamA [Comamonas odontotermitis]